MDLAPPTPESARLHLLDFVRWGHPSYQAGWFHRELCREIEQFSAEVAARRSPRLIISAPPRSGKSEIVSRRAPVWHLGQYPGDEVVVASYGQDLANDMSRDARGVRNQVIQEPGFQWHGLEPGAKDGVELWTLAGGGSYKAVGVGGPLTGRGAHCLIIDDPLKNAEEAESQRIRDARWDWYRTTAYTRLAPGGGVLIMATRWHHDDVTGRALAQLAAGEEPWRVVSFPAIAEEDEPYRQHGEALHPERYPLDDLERIRTVLGSRAWTALYQQRPTPETGGLFQRAWLGHRYLQDPQRPERPYDEIAVSVDATFKDGRKTDYVSIQTWGRYGWTEYHVLDEVHARMDFVATRQALRDNAKKWRPHAVIIEDAANGPALVADLRNEIPNVIPFNPARYGSKNSRAQKSTPTWESGAIRLPADAPWTADYVEEHCSFPLGAHDDRVDAMSQLLLWWGERRRGDTQRTRFRAEVDGMLARFG